MPTQPRASFLRSLPLAALALASVTNAQAQAAPPAPVSAAAHPSALSRFEFIVSPASGSPSRDALTTDG